MFEVINSSITYKGFPVTNKTILKNIRDYPSEHIMSLKDKYPDLYDYLYEKAPRDIFVISKKYKIFIIYSMDVFYDLDNILDELKLKGYEDVFALQRPCFYTNPEYKEIFFSIELNEVIDANEKEQIRQDIIERKKAKERMNKEILHRITKRYPKIISNIRKLINDKSLVLHLEKDDCYLVLKTSTNSSLYNYQEYSNDDIKIYYRWHKEFLNSTEISKEKIVEHDIIMDIYDTIHITYLANKKNPLQITLYNFQLTRD